MACHVTYVLRRGKSRKISTGRSWPSAARHDRQKSAKSRPSCATSSSAATRRFTMKMWIFPGTDLADCCLLGETALGRFLAAKTYPCACHIRCKCLVNSNTKRWSNQCNYPPEQVMLPFMYTKTFVLSLVCLICGGYRPLTDMPLIGISQHVKIFERKAQSFH